MRILGDFKTILLGLALALAGCAELPDGTSTMGNSSPGNGSSQNEEESDRPTVQFLADVSSGDEGTTSVDVVVTISELGTATVDYAVTGGTATGSGTDYTLASGTLTFVPPAVTQNISFTVADDALSEAAETIIIKLSNPSSQHELGSEDTHTYTITDNDPLPNVQFDLAADTGDEATTPVLLAVSLDAVSGQTVTVDYSATGGTASAGGVDFTLPAGTVSFDPGETTKNISLAIVDDAFDEPSETAEITLANPSGATLGATTMHTYTITDNDPAPTVSFDLASSSASEGTTPGDLAVSLSAASGFTVTVDYAVTGGTATGGGTDYTLASGTLTFNPGETTKNISATIVDDAIDESDETIEVTISNPTNSTLGATTVHTYTILDDDRQVFFDLASSNGDEGTSPANLSVSLSSSAGVTITVDYAVTGGTATGSGTDYTLASGTLTFVPTDVNELIPITITDDLLDEDDETIEVTLSNPTNATLGATTVHTYTINDNDAAPTVAFDLASSNAAESVSSANLAVSLSAASGKTVTVDYAVTGGTATGGGTDYTLASGTLTFNPGESTKNIAATIAEDALAEADETIEVTLSNPSNATLGATTLHTYTINDNDPKPTIEYDLTSSNGDESVTPANLAVSLSAVSGETITIDYDVTGGTSTGGGTDFTLASGTLTFNPGETTKNVVVTVVNDTLDEDDETIEVTLSNNTNSNLGTNTLHTYTINDNDNPPDVDFDLTSSSGSEATTPANLAVSLGTASGKTITVDYAVTGGTATGGGTDYTLASGTLTFNPGETTKNVAPTIVDDATPEPTETIEVTISNPSNASLGPNTIHTYSITDNDVLVSFDLASSSGDESVTPASLSVSLDSSSPATITVDYAVTGGTATGSGTDYTLASGTLTFVPTDTNENIDISIVDDALDEDAETIQVTLSNPINATLGATTVHTYTINDNDLPPTVAYDLASSSANERDGSANIAASLSGASGKTVTVDFSVTGGTATGGGTDYTLANGTLTFNPGETTKNVTPTIVDERILENGGETVDLDISNPGNATLGGQTTHTLTINDDPIASGMAFLTGTQTTNSTNINQTTAYAIEWSRGEFDSTYFDHNTGVNPERLTVKTAGDYFVAVTVPMTAAVARSTVRAEVRVNGTLYPGAKGESSYIRNSNAHTEASDHFAILLEGLAVNDRIEVFVWRTAAAGTVNISGQATMVAEYIAPARTIFTASATRTVASTNLNGNSASDLEWTEITKDTGFTHSDVTNPENITVDNAGDYLVHLNIPLNGSITRGSILATVKVDGSPVVGGQACQGYLRNSGGHNHTSVHWSGMLYNLTAGSIITVETVRTGGSGTLTVGTDVATVMIEKVDSSTNFVVSRGVDLTSGTNWNPGTADTIDWDTDDAIDTSVFTHDVGSTPEQITVDSGGDYLIMYNDVLTSTVARANPKIQVRVNGVVETGAEVTSHYIRASSGHNESSGSLVILLRDLVAGDVVSVQAVQEAQAGTVNDLDEGRFLIWKK